LTTLPFFYFFVLNLIFLFHENFEIKFEILERNLFTRNVAINVERKVHIKKKYKHLKNIFLKMVFNKKQGL